MINRNSETKREYYRPIHWIIISNILFTALILIIGAHIISQDIQKASKLGEKNLTHSDKTTSLIEHLVHHQLPFRKIVNKQKSLVKSFAYEFDLFVAKEDGQIEQLENSLSKMRNNYKRLESVWLTDLPLSDLHLLKAHINTTIGIYEEAAEFDVVGFGEIYRLAEESKASVEALISITNDIEGKMDEIVRSSELKAANESIITIHDNKNMLRLLDTVVKNNKLTLAVIFFCILIAQIVFFFIFKNRVDLFSHISNEISVQGNISKRIDLESKDKFGELAISFNKMLDNLQATTISKSFLNSIIESMDDAILVISPNGIIKSANSVSNKITGTETLVGASFYDLFSTELPDIIEIISNKQKTINLEKKLTRKDGSSIIVLFSVSNFINTGGSDEHGNVICVMRDITDRVQMELQKIQAEKIASEQTKYALIGQVAGKMAHDFNNVLGIIMGNVELLLMSHEDSSLKKTLNMIFDQTIRGKNLTKNLIAFAKNQEPEYKYFKIREKIDLVINLLKKDLSYTDIVIVDNAEDLEILADPGMIEHTLINLIQNSIHATCKTENPKIILRSYNDDESVCIEIEDNGCGIPKEFIENIFEPSFTLKGSRDTLQVYDTDIKGTGYGLSNVKKYIDQHNGEITLKSDLTIGTLVKIRLPTINQKLTPNEEIEIKQNITCVEKRILIVEDEPAISHVQSVVLANEPCRHKVEIASSGEAAIKLLNMNDYDAISLDYMLAGKMNGIDFYKYIRKNGNNIPILFVSGNIEFLESIKELKTKDSRIGYLSKPCQNKDYLYSIDTLLRKSS